MVIASLSGGVLVNWIALMITGRIFTYLSSSTQATWIEDAQASGLIVLITVTALAVVTWLHLSPTLVLILYIYLIYHAFQLEGFGDIVTFYFLHGAVNAVVIYLGLLPIFLHNMS